MEKTEGNTLIAKFMGLKECYLDNFNHMNYAHELLEREAPAYELKYHESWDWLMPVVEKLSNILRDIDSIPIDCSYCVWFTGDIHVSSNIAGVYEEVVGLVTWCNEHIKTEEDELEENS